MIELSDKSKELIENLLKQNKETLFRRIWKRYRNQDSCTRLIEYQGRSFSRSTFEKYGDWNLIAQHDILTDIRLNTRVEFPRNIAYPYFLNDPKWRYFIKITFKAFKKEFLPKQEKPKLMGATKTLKELINRGFIHREDAGKYDGFDPANKPYYVRTMTWEWNLFWPETFKTQEEAEKMNKRVGIPGRTEAVPDLIHIK